MYDSSDYFAAPEVPPNWESAIIPVDKPRGITSFDVIRRLRKITNQRKIGHAGTLDPMATGLLICLFGRSTKKMGTFLEMRKRYTGTIRMGETTPSYDADTPVVESKDIKDLDTEQVQGAAELFVGELRQETPMYSAVRHQGERLYKKARRGEKVKSPIRDVSVYSFEVGELSGPDIPFDITCSKGTYIRAIAHDIGQALNVGAHLIELRRINVGDIHVDQAWDLDELGSHCTSSTTHLNTTL